MPTFAAIDIGSNSCRLKIASVEQHHLKTLHEDREVTRLGESVFQTGVISPEAMAGTIRALRRFHKAVQLHVADKVRVVATSAMRDARNAAAFTAWVKSATGWNVEVISGLEEGRLIHLGVVTHEPGAKGRCLLIDLGGGSCEVTLSDGGTIKQMVSLPLGAVRLQQEFLQQDPPAKEDLARLQQYIDRELKRAERKLGTPRVGLVIATSGTAAALAEASVAMTSKLPVRKTAPKTFVRHKPQEAETAGGAEAGGPAGEDGQRAAGGDAGDWAEAVGDHRGRRAGLCDAAGADGAEGISLLAAGAAGWHAGADAGRGGSAGLGAPQDRDRALGGRAGGLPAVWHRSEEGGAGAPACGASCSTRWLRCMSCRRSTSCGWRRRR